LAPTVNSQKEPCASVATLLAPAAFIAASSELKRSICQYSVFARDPTTSLLVRIVQPSSPRRSGEFSIHFTGERVIATFAFLLSLVVAQEHTNKNKIMEIQILRFIRLRFGEYYKINVKRLYTFHGGHLPGTRPLFSEAQEYEGFNVIQPCNK
jgi:hypothetical protein